MESNQNQHQGGKPSSIERWERLAKTDPVHTKQFNRGGFKGTALKPIWLIKRMTEEFGTAGKDWGTTEPKFDTVFIPDKEPLVYCTVGLWIGSDSWVIHGVGGDTLVRTFKNGESVVDDEAFKKAYTDAINNAFKFLGIGGDVHMGQFEDSKYVKAVSTFYQQQSETPEIKTVKEIIDKIEQIKTLADLDAIIKQNKETIDIVEQQRPALVQSLRSSYAMQKQKIGD